ncbi:hypothetical protein FHT77_003506 [Rhizobium sp. BK181]|uniref:hypothetical protein n=1 Tax=Rhizobium sp. BK181 TaxID=2587072 RepID=UPI00161FCEEC|nr:hypothetical protein [Rhizobium sp. BK181]MBB3317617.1 hypothetical protein [Rhizobium sp. BK181]
MPGYNRSKPHHYLSGFHWFEKTLYTSEAIRDLYRVVAGNEKERNVLLHRAISELEDVSIQQMNIENSCIDARVIECGQAAIEVRKGPDDITSLFLQRQGHIDGLKIVVFHDEHALSYEIAEHGRVTRNMETVTTRCL